MIWRQIPASQKLPFDFQWRVNQNGEVVLQRKTERGDRVIDWEKDGQREKKGKREEERD